MTPAADRPARRVLDAWHTQKEALGPEWAAVASLNDHGMRLRPDQARALADELNAVLDRWMTEHPGDQPVEGPRPGLRAHRRRAAEGVAAVSAPTTVRSATRRPGRAHRAALAAGRAHHADHRAPRPGRGLSLAEIGLLFTVHGDRGDRPRAADRRAGRRARPPSRRRRRGRAAGPRVLRRLRDRDELPGFLAGVLLMGVGRALDSGPVEAWYVDTVHRIDPAADVAPGLSRHSAADGGQPRRRRGRRRLPARTARRGRRRGARAALPRRRRPRPRVRRRGRCGC